jgi:hypothetical protein
METIVQARYDFAKGAATAYGELPGVVAVALAGSTTSGATDAESDLDLYVYAAEPVDLAGRRGIAARYAIRSEIGNDAWEPGDEWIDARTGYKADVIYRTPAWIEDQLDRVLVRHQASVGYSTTFWHNLLHSVPLVDPDGWYLNLQRAASRPYPEALKRAIVARNWPLLRQAMSSYLNQIRLAAGRGDIVSVQHRVSGLLSSYFDILFAINEMPHPGEKRLLQFSVDGRLKLPCGMIGEIDALLRTQPGPAVVACAATLIDGLDTLLAEESLLPTDTQRSGQAKP